MSGKVSKLFRYVLYFILFCVLLRACGAITLHDHEWQEATCTTPKTCSVCGDTEGDPLCHHWTEATCIAPKTCSVCGEAVGGPSKHDWIKATCEVPKTCSVCGAQDGEALGHHTIPQLGIQRSARRARRKGSAQIPVLAVALLLQRVSP